MIQRKPMNTPLEENGRSPVTKNLWSMMISISRRWTIDIADIAILYVFHHRNNQSSHFWRKLSQPRYTKALIRFQSAEAIADSDAEYAGTAERNADDALRSVHAVAHAAHAPAPWNPWTWMDFAVTFSGNRWLFQYLMYAFLQIKRFAVTIIFQSMEIPY